MLKGKKKKMKENEMCKYCVLILLYTYRMNKKKEENILKIWQI